MSIQDSGGQISYSDHDVHHIVHRVSTTSGEPDGNDSVNEQAFEITERGLDPDELAELRAMRVTVGTTFKAVAAEDNVGSVEVSAGAGFNTSGDEFLLEAGSETTLDTDDDGSDDLIVEAADTDEVGQLWTYFNSVSAPYDDDTNGNGGGGLGVDSVEMLQFPELTGSGPYVDAADDFVSRIRVEETANEAAIGVAVQYSLYYDVNQQEGGRTRFGR